MTNKIIGYSQALPDGIDRHDIPELLRHISEGIPATLQVKDNVLHDVGLTDEVPSCGVYGTMATPSANEYREYSCKTFTRATKSAGDLAQLFLETSNFIREQGISDVYDLVLHQDNYEPYSYSVTMYYLTDNGL